MDSPDTDYGAIRRGILWMLLTVFIFVSMDTIGKYLTQTYPVLQVTWARFFFHAFWLAVFLRRRLLTAARTRRPALQLSRGLLLLVANTFFVAAVSVMPLVNVNSILLLSPLVVTALSVPLLGEQVGVRRWACVVAGGIGALIIIRPGIAMPGIAMPGIDMPGIAMPGSGLMQWVALLPLGSACCFALYQIATRVLARSDPPLTTLFYSVSVGVPLTSLAVPWVWVTPDWQGWALMAVMGLMGGVSHFTLIKAFTAAPVAVVSPFTYTNLVWATLFGFVVFAELPDRWTVMGAALIIVSGLYAFVREQRRGAETRATRAKR